MSAGSHPAVQNSFESKNITEPNGEELARTDEKFSVKQYLFCLQLTFFYALKNSPPHFQT